MSYRNYGDPVEPPRMQVERALRAWSGFPVDHDPRPLVVLSPEVAPGGFPDGATKLAFIHGAIDAVPGFPAEVLDALRPAHQDHDGPRLLVTTATRDTAKFVTDRGPRQLPAWHVRAQDVPAPIKVLDRAVSQQAWRPPGPDQPGWRGTVALLNDEGRTVTLQFTGIPFGYADYPGAEVLEAGQLSRSFPQL